MTPAEVSAEAAQASASASQVAFIAGGTKYKSGITTGAKVGIAFAAVIGAIIVGLVVWRCVIHIRNPKPKRGKKPMPKPPAAAAPARGEGGADGDGGHAGKKGIGLPWGKQKYAPMPGVDDHEPMMMSSSAAPVFDTNTGYMSAGPGGDLGHREADTYGDGHEHERQGLVR